MAVEVQLVVFSVGGDDFGLPIECVREVAPYSRPRRLGPREPWRLGVVLLRGELLPLVDLGLRLGGRAAAAEDARVVVVDGGEQVVGLVVERVVGVRAVAVGAFAPVPVAADPAVAGIVAGGDRLIAVLDADRVLGLAEPPAEPAPEPDLASLPKRELVRLARVAGIVGRSTMSRDELVAALSAGRPR